MHDHLRAAVAVLPLYELTLPAATLLRPLLLRAVAALVDEQPPSAQLAVALLSVLELAPHTEG